MILKDRSVYVNQKNKNKKCVGPINYKEKLRKEMKRFKDKAQAVKVSFITDYNVTGIWLGVMLE